VLETDEKGRIKLSLKALLDKPEGYVEEERPRREYGDRPRRDDRGPRRDREPREHREPRPDAPAADAAAPAPRDDGGERQPE
jgi:polyribonucleotide nucleotidyltransferase